MTSLNHFTAYSFHSIELKLGGMILDISPHNRSGPYLSVTSRKRCGGALLKFSNRFTFDFLPGGDVGARFRNLQINSHPTVFMRLISNCRMILNIILHSRYEQDFFRSMGRKIFRIFCGRHLYMFPRLAVTKLSTSSIWEMTTAPVRRCFLLSMSLLKFRWLRKLPKVRS